jgi:tyrosine-protein kinase Etk/Wzc
MNEASRESESQQVLPALGRVLKRRKLLLGLCLLGVLAPIVVYNETTPPLYEATTSLVFEELGSPGLNDVTNSSSPELYLFNRIEEIKSRAFADDVARALPSDLRARFPKPEPLPPNFDLTEHIGAVINRSITAAPLRSSNIVRIRVQMSDPHLCLAIANLSLDVLQERNYRIRHEGVADLRKFIEAQLSRFSTQLQDSERQLMMFKQANAITSLDNESQEVLRRMTEAEVLFNTTRADQDAARERLAAVETTLVAQRSGLVNAVTNIASPSTQKLKDRLVQLQSEFAQLAVQGYPEDHPQRLRLLDEIEQTKKALTDEATKVAMGSQVGDPIAKIESFIDQKVGLQIEIESMRAREGALSRTLGGYRAYLARLPAKEVELARLTLDRDVNARIYSSLLERREEVRISEAKHIPNSRIIDRGEFPKSPIKPRKGLNLLLGSMVGLIVWTGLGLVLESKAGKMGSMQEFEQQTGWSVLALVPAVERQPSWRRWLRLGWPQGRGATAERGVGLVSHLNPESAAGEAYFMLRTRLELLGMGTKYRSLMITSSWPQEGKSSTLANLAATFGAAGGTTLVVDAELRRPVQHTIFGVSKAPGLSDLLLSRNGDGKEYEVPARSRRKVVGATAEVGDDVDAIAAETEPARRSRRKTIHALTPDGMFQPTSVEGITLLASGKRIRESQWETARPRMRELVDELEKGYDVVLVDSASPMLVHDTLTLCGIVDAVVVVVDAQSYDETRLMETKRLLEHAGANVVGAVVNRVDPGGRYAYYYHHYY